jgi:hypothetical protein
MSIITLADVKTLTGITTTDQDAAITAILPYLEAKVKEITGRKWTKRVTIETALGDTEAAVEPIDYDDAYTTEPYNGNVGNRRPLDLLHEFIEVGAKISGTGIADGTYIEDKYSRDYIASTNRIDDYTVVVLSQAATASGTAVATIGMNMAYMPTVAKLALWMIGQQTTAEPASSVASKSLGDISVSYSTAGADLDGRFGVPSWCVRGLPRYGRGY